MFHYTNDIEGMGQYNWAKDVQRVVMKTIEDTQKKLSDGPLSELQLNNLWLLIQARLKIVVLSCINACASNYCCWPIFA